MVLRNVLADVLSAAILALLLALGVLAVGLPIVLFIRGVVGAISWLLSNIAP